MAEAFSGQIKNHAPLRLTWVDTPKRICLTDTYIICNTGGKVKGFLKNIEVMSLTFIIGETGAGKTAFATYLLKEKYITEGRNLLRRSCRIIEEANRKYGRNYTVPDKVPFYTNYNVKLHVGYRKYYEPYFLNGYYFGVENEEIDTERVAPENEGCFQVERCGACAAES